MEEARTRGEVLRLLLVIEAADLQLLPWEELKAPRDGEWGGLYVERSAATFLVHRPGERDLPHTTFQKCKIMLVIHW